MFCTNYLEFFHTEQISFGFPFFYKWINSLHLDSKPTGTDFDSCTDQPIASSYHGPHCLWWWYFSCVQPVALPWICTFTCGDSRQSCIARIALCDAVFLQMRVGVVALMILRFGIAIVVARLLISA